VIVFRRLPAASLYQVVDKMLADLRTRLAERQLTLELSDDARAWLVKNGYDEAYGARPLRRLIQKEVENALARQVLGSELADGDHIKVDVAEDRLSFERLATREPVEAPIWPPSPRSRPHKLHRQSAPERIFARPATAPRRAKFFSSARHSTCDSACSCMTPQSASEPRRGGRDLYSVRPLEAHELGGPLVDQALWSSPARAGLSARP